MSDFDETINETTNLTRRNPLAMFAEHQAVTVRQTHAQVLNESQKMFDRWVTRRNQTAEELLAISRKALQAGSPLDVIELWTQWSEGFARRLGEDIKDHLEVSSTIARCCTKAVPGISALAQVVDGAHKEAANGRAGQQAH